MRGTRKSTWLGACPCGIIPAHAGNTGEGAETRAYPIGSSPRMRGTPDAVNHAPHAVGIIPAHAGNTAPTPTWSRRPRDHPRACGEHNTGHHRRTLRTGSSPRMRGTRFGGEQEHRHSGIIPAHAGNTSAPGRCQAGSGDHPRACGEHLPPSEIDTWQAGSSPRMRGTRVRELLIGAGNGIIPAHAGNTYLRVVGVSALWDHPRACGEHTEYEILAILLRGSSPRMRGTPHQQLAVRYRVRIIPAHAGNTDRISECTR